MRVTVNKTICVDNVCVLCDCRFLVAVDRSWPRDHHGACWLDTAFVR